MIDASAALARSLTDGLPQTDALERALNNYRNAADDDERGLALDALAELAQTDGAEICKALCYQFAPPTATLAEYRDELTRGMGVDATEQLFADLSHLASEVRAANKSKIVVINATFVSGGVAEMFRTQATILGALGITVEWHTTHVGRASAYAEVGRKVFDAIQGGSTRLTDADKAVWQQENERLAQVLSGVTDDPTVAAIFLEDYHPIHLLSAFKQRNPHLRIIWRAHNDHHGILANLPAGADVWHSVIKPQLAHLGDGDAALFQPFSVPLDATTLRCGIFVLPAGVDPLAPKNRPLAPHALTAALHTVAPTVNPGRPCLVAGGRFVVWKGLLPLLRAWERLATTHPDIDLVLFGAVGTGDARKTRYVALLEQEIAAFEAAHPAQRGRVHMLKLKDEDIRPFYALAAKHHLPFCQPSVREGYGLMADEAARQGAVPFTSAQGGLRRFANALSMHGFCVDTALSVAQIIDPANMYTCDPDNAAAPMLPTGAAVTALEAHLHAHLDALLAARRDAPEAFALRYNAAAKTAHQMALDACLVVMSRDYLALCVATPQILRSARLDVRAEDVTAAPATRVAQYLRPPSH